MIELIVNNRKHGGWKSASVELGISQACSSFSLIASDRWPGSRDIPSVKAGDECRIEVNSKRLITGYVDEVDPRYSVDTHEVSFMGRSKVQDLVDCSYVSNNTQFKDLSIEQIAKVLCKPFGVGVVMAADPGGKIKDFQVNQGETPFEALSRIAKRQGLLVNDNAQGDLVLTTVSTQKARGIIKRIEGASDNNVLSAGGKFSKADRYSDYIVKGQSGGSDLFPGEQSSSPTARIKDDEIKRYRPLVIIAEGSIDSEAAKKRAQWERANRSATSISLNYTLNNWTEDGKILWSPNKLVFVHDDRMKIKGTFLIERVVFNIGDSGSSVTLSLGLPEAYKPEPDSASEKKRTIASWFKSEE